MNQILVVDDERNIRLMLRGLLEDEGYRVSTVADVAAAEEAIAALAPDLLLLDLLLPGSDGLTLLERLRASGDPPAVIMMSGHGTIDAALRAIRLGALDFIEKPIQPERLLVAIGNALRLRRLHHENSALRRELAEEQRIIGEGPATRRLRDEIARAAASEARVLISGEHGTGKELVAHALHAASRRRSHPFIKVNCAAIPAELLESELFGHERGAFTGAVARRLGKFERAQEGTLLLDEIGDMNPTTQAKLLRVLEEGELERLGGERVVRLDVRVIASTNRDLPRLMRGGQFRPDLYHRLKVIPIEVPPLRQRPEEIPLLVRHFLDHFCDAYGRPRRRFSAEALELLCAYPWPGNVRELRNLMERCVIMADGEEVRAGAIRALLAGGDSAEEEPEQSMTLAEALEAHERRLLRRALAEARGNIAAAARALGLDRSNLHRRLRRLKLDPHDMS
jgi:DNA-binding NtrC family response regulator